MKPLNRLLNDYYTNLYKNQLGLKDYQWRVQNRVNEDKVGFYYSADKYINLFSKLVNLDLKNKKVLVIGAGTGAEMIQFHRLKAKVIGIDPNGKALEIIKLKLKNEKLSEKIAIKAAAENLPFKNKEFDLVYCWQVLEHVQDLKKSLKEIIRVCKRNGYVFIGTPDYRQIVEPHYKMYLPMFLPKFLVKWLIKLRGRKTDFFDSLQWVTADKIKTILKQMPVTMMQIINAYSKKDKQSKGLTKLMHWIEDNLGIEQDQYWIIKRH